MLGYIKIQKELDKNKIHEDLINKIKSNELTETVLDNTVSVCGKDYINKIININDEKLNPILCCAKYGNLETLKLLCIYGFINYNTFSLFFKYSDVEKIKYLIDYYLTDYIPTAPKSNLLDAVINKNVDDIINNLSIRLSSNYNILYEGLITTIKNNKLEVVEYMMKNVPLKYDEKLFDLIISNNFHELFTQMIHENYIKESQLFDMIINNNYRNILLSICDDKYLNLFILLFNMFKNRLDKIINKLFTYSILRNQSKLFDFLIEQKNIDINCTNEFGDNQLITAIKNNNLHIAKILIEKNIDLFYKTTFNKTPYSFALKYKNPDMIQLIKESLIKYYQNEIDKLNL